MGVIIVKIAARQPRTCHSYGNLRAAQAAAMNRVSALTHHLSPHSAASQVAAAPAAAAALSKSYSGAAAADEVGRIRAEDPHAPHFHFIAPDPAFPFDPNGTLFWKGRYHLFYIFQDESLRNGGHCWGRESRAVARCRSQPAAKASQLTRRSGDSAWL
jgi:hypothetical protein